MEISDCPKRIVSLVPSQTELLAYLGLKDRIVGITKFCVHPKALRKQITVVGGTKKVNYGKIVKLKPDLIICNKEENSEAIVAQLEGIAPIWISDIRTMDDALDMIRSVGSLTDSEVAADALCINIIQGMNRLKEFVRNRPTRKVIYLIWKDPYMAAGKNTFIDTMLTLNNYINVVGEKRYPEVTSEDLSMADLIMISTEPYPFKQQHASNLKSALGIDTMLVDGTYFSWYGCRLAEAFHYFETLDESTMGAS